VPASELVCPIDAPTAISSDHHASISDLLWIARAGDHLLDRRCDQHPDDRREGNDTANFLNEVAQVALVGLAEPMIVKPHEILEVLPERQREFW
jgi:hypothetical protein